MAPSVIRAKCVVVGDVTVGKSALTQMFISNGRKYPKNYNVTLGVDLTRKCVAVPNTDCSVDLLIYDTGGLDIYKDVIPKYWNQPDLILAVFDVTSPDSLTSLSKWIPFVHQYKSSSNNATHPCAIFGNKTDLAERRLVSLEHAKNEAEKLGAAYFEGSAKENQSVEEPFSFLAQEWFNIAFSGRSHLKMDI